MRSSKSRSRSKSNRQRSLGNIINRVFDSSGPEGKVRGTPQQIIDKYLMLARDAQLSNDRVAEQNFLQHAEHYTRMLSEAQREMQREQELRQSQNPGQNAGQGGGYAGGQNGERSQNGRERYDSRQDRGADVPDSAGYVLDDEPDADAGLVETPETRGPSRDDARSDARDLPEPAPRRRAAAAPAARVAETGAPVAAPDDAAPEAAAPRKDRGPRGPRRPREKREDAAAGSDTRGDDQAPASE
jgi:hypothetical protein